MNNSLTFETEDSSVKKVTIQYDRDTTFDEVFEIFRLMALCMGFHEQTVAEYFHQFEPNKEVIDAKDS